MYEVRESSPPGEHASSRGGIITSPDSSRGGTGMLTRPACHVENPRPLAAV
jgi:hypothetical protein